MSVREFLNRHQTASIVGCAVMVITVLLAVILFSRGDDASAGEGGSAYYTIDEGRSWFSDSPDRLPPFDHDGKQAVRVHLYSVDNGKTKFAGYLERYTDTARATLEKSRSGTMIPLNELTQATSDVEVKKPGDTAWVRRNDPAAAKAVNVEPPAGKSGAPVPVR